jgi:hypothetical protein
LPICTAVDHRLARRVSGSGPYQLLRGLASDGLLATRDIPQRRGIIGLTVAIFIVWTILMTVSGVLVAAYKCDEGCLDDVPGVTGDWSRFPDAWQWQVIGLAGGVIFVSGAAYLIALAARSRRGTLVSKGIHLGAVLTLAVTRATSDGWSPDDDHFLLMFLIGEASALVAASLVLRPAESLPANLK